jgi:putative ABC transport system permease protein
MTLQIPSIVGVPEALLAGDVAPGALADPAPGDAIPVVISRRLVEVYNGKIAPAMNVRRLPPGLSLVGLELPVRVGFSIVPQKTEDRVVDARLKLVGLSDRVPLESVAFPLETVRRLHRDYGKRDDGYTEVTLYARRPDDVPVITAAIRRMGFAVDEDARAAAERVGTVVAVTTGALVFLAGVMCALAALAIAQSLSASVRARVREIAVLEALGAAPGDVRAIVLLEGALVGLGGGVVGVLLGRALAFLADRGAARLLPEFPFRPETYFLFPPWVLALGLLVPALAAVVGALAPAATAAHVDPARTLS